MAWSDHVAAALDQALDGDGDVIGQEVRDGDAWCFEFVGLAYVVCRVEQFTNGKKEFVVVAGQGSGFNAVMPALVDMATSLGCHSLRMHSKNPAIGRMGRRFGFETTEYVFKAVIDGQQQQK